MEKINIAIDTNKFSLDIQVDGKDIVYTQEKTEKSEKFVEDIKKLIEDYGK